MGDAFKNFENIDHKATEGAPPPPTPKVEGDYITLKVVGKISERSIAKLKAEGKIGNDGLGRDKGLHIRNEEDPYWEIHFRVKQGTMLGKLKRSYADRVGEDVKNLKFIIYGGYHIADDDTPARLRMETDDFIDVQPNLAEIYKVDDVCFCCYFANKLAVK